jgi:PAS domain S-box-containing protein
VTHSILVVEDEFIVCMEIEERLKAMGYRIAGSADTGAQAVELAGAQRPDLVLMDISLRGDMNGITAAEEIRRRYRLPVIFLTAYSEDSTLERAKLAEPYGYILKPFEARELKTVIEIALFRHGAEEEIRRLNRLYDVLTQVNQAVARIPDRDSLFQAICRLAVERGAVDLAWIDWLEPGTGRTKIVARFGDKSELLQETGGCPGDRGETKERPLQQLPGAPMVCNDSSPGACPQFSSCAAARLGFRSCGSFPVLIQGHVYGTLRLACTAPGFFRDQETGLLREVAMDISFALEKMEDAASRARAEIELRMSEEKFRSYIEHAPLGVLVADRTGRYLESNPAAAKMLGYNEEEFAGMSVPDIIAAESLQAGLQHFHTVLMSGSANGEYRIRRKDGSELWASVSAVKIDDNHFLAFCQDITGRKQTEEEKNRVEAQLRQVQKMEAIGHLAGGIAHDFNNILAAIIGYTEMAIEGAPQTGDFDDDLKEILAAGQRAKELVTQILTFSRQTEREPELVEVIYIVKEAVKMLRAMLPSTIELCWKSGVHPQSRVLADPTEIHQVVMNLCTNAAHAMREKGGKLDIEVGEVVLGDDAPLPHPDLAPGDYLRLRITDTGHGMSEEVMVQMFDPFFTTKAKGEGTGMGLSVLHGIVKSCNGAITVESEEGAGSTFNVYFPRISVESPETARDAKTLIRGKGHILFVDDEKPLADFGKKMLEQLGYSVTTTNSSKKALEIFTSNPSRFDLLITDYTMPRMTGLDLAREVKRVRPGMPVILCSGFNDKVDELNFSSFGIEAFIPKPFNIHKLSRLVKSTLERAST